MSAIRPKKITVEKTKMERNLEELPASASSFAAIAISYIES